MFSKHVTCIIILGDSSYYFNIKLLQTLFRDVFHILVRPSKLKIVNATHKRTVNGRENCPLTLVCLVDRGKPPAVLKWKHNGIVISQGGSSNLVYTFTPNKADDQSVYTCEAKQPDMKSPLAKSVHLNIKCEYSNFILRVNKVDLMDTDVKRRYYEKSLLNMLNKISIIHRLTKT